MCGLVGIVGRSNVNQFIYDALTALQHRGQDAAGIMTFANGNFHQRKSEGLVRDVFRQHHMQRLQGTIGLGHVRYPTAGSNGPALAQPFYVNSPYGIGLVHNGNLTNSVELTQDLFQTDLRHINTDSDSEILLNVFAHELQRQGRIKPTAEDIFAAVAGVHERCRGGYAAIAMVANYGLVAFRDVHGIRPLVVGQRAGPQGRETMFASESVALDMLGFSLLRDVGAGEAIYISAEGKMHVRQCAKKARLTPCIFEHVYFARPDSLMDGISIYKTRLRQGEVLARKVLAQRPGHDIDVVIPVPDTSRIAAQSMASVLGLKFREGLVKNRYIGRTFIMPGQSWRQKSVRQKLNIIPLEFEGKNVMLVDDSIVRGTTCRQIIDIAREAGANKVYFASAAPPVRHPNVYGIDMPCAEELIAHGRDEAEICELIGADWLVYQDLDELVASSREGNPGIEQYDCSVFDGHYVTGDVDQGYLDRIKALRSNGAQQRQLPFADDGYVASGLHNEVAI